MRCMAATRKIQVAPESLLQTRSTFTKSIMVSMSVSKLGWMVQSRPDFLSTLEWRSMMHTTVRCFWLKSYCLSCVRSVASSLSSSKAMLLLTERVRQSTFWNETPAFILPDFWRTNSTDLNQVYYKNMGINAAAGLPRSWGNRKSEWSFVSIILLN